MIERRKDPSMKSKGGIQLKFVRQVVEELHR